MRTTNPAPQPSTKLSADALAAIYTRAGLPCLIEAGRVLVVYAASPAVCASVASQIANEMRKRDPKAAVDCAPQFDKDEPAETAWWTTIAFDLGRF